MRALLRRRLQDTAATPELSDANLNELLNLALLDIQEAVLAVDPGAFVSVDTFDQAASQERYDKPPGFLYEYELAILDASKAAGWRPLIRQSYQESRLRVSGATVAYSSLGRFFYLSPIPSASVNEGLRLTWVYSLSMNADSDVPLLVLPLHDAVVDAAMAKALSETSELEAMDRANARVARKLERLPTYYRRSRNPLSIQPALRRNLSNRHRLARDVYQS